MSPALGPKRPITISVAFNFVPNCESIVINPNVPDSSQRKILSLYQNTTKRLSLHSIPPDELRESILVQNLDCLRHHYVPNKRMTLENMLLANSTALGVYRLDLKILNKFLKLWIRKKCNPRLEYLWTERLELDVDSQMVLAGINNKEVSNDTLRIFKLSKKAVGANAEWLKMTDTVEVRGGYDFRRRDGTRATITVREVNGNKKLEFFVWSFV